MRKVLILTAIGLVFSACKVQGAVIDSNWVGDDGYWNEASNWNPEIVPDNNGSQTFAVRIDGGGGDKKHVFLLESRTINQLDAYGNVWLGSQTPYDIVFTLMDTNGLTNYGNLRIRGGTYNEMPEFTIEGSVKNESGSTLGLFGITIEGDFYNTAGATTRVEYENVFPRGFQNEGTIIISPASIMSADANIINAGQIQILGGTCAATGLLGNEVNGVIEGFGVVPPGQSIENSGKIYASAGSLLLYSDTLTNTGTLGNKPLATLHLQPAVDVNNSGTIEVNAGGGVAFDCNLINEPNGIIKLLGGTLSATTITQTPDANFTGFGTIAGDVIINPNGIIELTGPTNIVGDVNIPTGATLEISDGQTLIIGHTICDGTIHLIGGTVVFQGGCDCEDCNIINEAGIDRNHFDLNADGIEDFKDFAYFAETWLWQASWY